MEEEKSQAAAAAAGICLLFDDATKLHDACPVYTVLYFTQMYVAVVVARQVNK